MNKRRYRFTIALIILVGAGLVLFRFIGVLQPFENLVVRVLQPFQAMAYQLVRPLEWGFSEERKSVEELEKQLIDAQKRIDSLSVDNAYLRTAVSQAELLEQQVAFLNNRSLQAVTAKIVSRSTEGISQQVVINRGTNDGVVVGYPVIVSNGVLIGIVTEADDASSFVTLLTSDASQVSARVQNNESSPGIVRGDHGISMRMEFIPQLDTVSIGNAIVTSGADQFVPEGVVIGEVVEVTNAAGSLFQSAAVRPLFHASELSIVSVVVP